MPKSLVFAGFTYNHALNFYTRYHSQLQILLVHSFNVENYLDDLSAEVSEAIRNLEHYLVDLESFEEAHGPSAVRDSVSLSLDFHRTLHQHLITNVADIRQSSDYLRSCIRHIRNALLLLSDRS